MLCSTMTELREGSTAQHAMHWYFLQASELVQAALTRGQYKMRSGTGTRTSIEGAKGRDAEAEEEAERGTRLKQLQQVNGSIAVAE